MRGDDIAERLAGPRHIVPGERHAAPFRHARHLHIGDQPGRIAVPGGGDFRGQPRGHEARHREYGSAGKRADRLAGADIEMVDRHASTRARDSVDDLAGQDMRGKARRHEPGEPGIALRPGEFVGACPVRRPAAPPGEIMDARPGRDMFRLAAIIVAHRIADMAAQHAPAPPLRLEPAGKAHRVQCQQRRVARAIGDGTRKGRAAIGAGHPRKARHRLLERHQLGALRIGNPGARDQPFLPAPLPEQPLLQIGTQLFGVIERRITLHPLDDAEAGEHVA